MIPFSFNFSASIRYFTATFFHHCRSIFFQNEVLQLIIMWPASSVNLPRFIVSIYRFSFLVILLAGIRQYFRSYSVVYQFWEWVIFGSSIFLKSLLWDYMQAICICINSDPKWCIHGENKTCLPDSFRRNCLSHLLIRPLLRLRNHWSYTARNL